MAPPGSLSRPDCLETVGVWDRMVTAEPGRHESRVSPGVRYCLARAKLCAGLALASKKPYTTVSGLHPACGPRTISPQQLSPPAAKAGLAAAGCGEPLDGIAAQPPASSTIA